VAIAVHGQEDVAKIALDLGPPVTEKRQPCMFRTRRCGAFLL
jgi:hypothetical protein